MTEQEQKKVLQYLSRASIIPVGKNKKPLIAWKEYQSRKPTEEEVKEWFQKFPDMNVAIITGKISNLAVVDVEKGGDIAGLPDTLIAKSGGGGWHYYYQYAEGIENKARVRVLTDIRGEGGYVVCYPSIHQSGNQYLWFNQKTPSAFPKYLFGLKEKKWDEIYSGVSEGQRNETASRYIGKLMSVFSPDTWESSVWETVREWNKKNTPSLSETELRTTYESIKRRAIKNPRAETIKENIGWITMTELVGRGKKELLQTKQEDIVSFGYDWLDNQLTGLFPGELVVIGGESGSGKTTFAINIVYRASEKRKCAVFALEDRLNDYSIKKLYFEIGRIRRSQGLKNYHWNTYRKNVVSDKESFLSEIDRAEKNLINDNILFADIDRQMDIDLLEQLIEEQVANGVQLFLIDHLHYFDLLKGKSSKADYIEQVMVRLKNLQNRTGARVIMVVHYKKLEGAKPRLDSFKDSISIIQNANYVINIWRDRSDCVSGEERYKTTFSVPKSRNPNGEGTILVEFDPEINDYKNIQQWNFGTGSDTYREITEEEL